MVRYPATYGVSPDQLPLPKDELLCVLRGLQELSHFSRITIYSVASKWLLNPQFHKPVDFDGASNLRLEDANDACNRTAAVYLLRDLTDPDHPENGIYLHNYFKTVLLISQLFRYTYHRWFRPYKSEIDRDQFLTKVNLPPASILPLETCSLAMVDWVRRQHSNFCERIESIKSQRTATEELEVDEPFYIMQPVFYAVAVALRTCTYDIDIANFGDTPVLIVCTGVERGLSAPIDLSTIDEEDRRGVVTDSSGKLVAVETALSVAITFLIALERREQQVFGMKPDPIRSTRVLTDYDDASEAKDILGWETETMGVLRGPSSTCVEDPEKCPAETSTKQERLEHFDRICRFHRPNAEEERAKATALLCELP
ncbi:hypothetical protein NLG97_g9853 [Lecanicillium saksenae]|uniref:Uncharacterized protein n=1 Tax=Lecanicillium saksenae TaxID=468837 RepID=A0ACC1QF36_9HYPO|nr:hypothetical protein NLG97_g9853 [Lecanicillium saksenae]